MPGTVDIDQRGYIFGACLKSHEDTLSCNDILHAVSIVALASFDKVLTYKPCHGIFNHACMGVSSFIVNIFCTATSILTSRRRTTWLESSDEEAIDL